MWARSLTSSCLLGTPVVALGGGQHAHTNKRHDGSWRRQTYWWQPSDNGSGGGSGDGGGGGNWGQEPGEVLVMLVVCSGTEEVEARRRWAAKGGAGWGRETYLALDCSHLEGAVGLAAQTRTSRPCYRQTLPCKAARVPRWAARGGSSSCDLGPGAWGHGQAMLHVWRLCRGARRGREEAHESAQASKHSRATQLACLPFPPEVPFTCGAACCTWHEAATTQTQTTAC